MLSNNKFLTKSVLSKMKILSAESLRSDLVNLFQSLTRADSELQNETLQRVTGMQFAWSVLLQALMVCDAGEPSQFWERYRTYSRTL